MIRFKGRGLVSHDHHMISSRVYELTNLLTTGSTDVLLKGLKLKYICMELPM